MVDLSISEDNLVFKMTYRERGRRISADSFTEETESGRKVEGSAGPSGLRCVGE